ncbi:hypothetical protein D3C84_442690 [compost metagenome]
MPTPTPPEAAVEVSPPARTPTTPVTAVGRPSAPNTSATEPRPVPLTRLPLTVPPSLTEALSAFACGRSSTMSMLTLAEALARPSPTLIRKPSVSGPVASVVASVRV